jgi:hypothetical protein
MGYVKEIKSSSRQAYVIAILCALGLAAGTIRYLSPKVAWNQFDNVATIMIAVGFLFFLFRALKPKTLMKVTNVGLWTSQTGMLKWNAVQSVKIESRSGYKGVKNKQLRIVLKPREKGFEEISYELQKIKISEEEVTEELIPFIQEKIIEN